MNRKLTHVRILVVPEDKIRYKRIEYMVEKL